jgi:hypothetical protein
MRQVAAAFAADQTDQIVLSFATIGELGQLLTNVGRFVAPRAR